MRFKGVIKGIVTIKKHDFLEIEIAPEVFAYFWIYERIYVNNRDGICHIKKA
jgi:hypothetical protein